MLSFMVASDGIKGALKFVTLYDFYCCFTPYKIKVTVIVISKYSTVLTFTLTVAILTAKEKYLTLKLKLKI